MRDCVPKDSRTDPLRLLDTLAVPLHHGAPFGDNVG